MFLFVQATTFTPAVWVRALLGAAATALLVTGCKSEPSPDALLQRSIQVHGADRLENAQVSYDFRDFHFVQTLEDGWFRLERIYEDDGQRIREVMTNDGTFREVDGEPVPLSEEERRSVETGVNSVMYFAFLPFRLQDPAVLARYLGEETLDGEPYHRVEVTFRPEGGGRDWEDRYVYWLHQEEGTLDYLAYLYHVGDGGTRFRRAINRRVVDGIVAQDYENFTASDLEDIATYGLSYGEGRLEWVSDVIMENVSVAPPPAGFPFDDGAPAGVSRPDG